MQTMFVDISSLSWDDDAYNVFFENLSFQDKQLTYSLAIRDETKDLTFNNVSSALGENEVIGSIKETLSDEYGDDTFAELRETVVISGSTKEKMKGIFVFSKRHHYLGILVYLVPIGRKLKIKFYRLLVPTENNKTISIKYNNNLYY